ncbi:MAG: hypothetical protein ACMXYM_05530 [Candidatus Woesearchaeota archaeon]
MDDMRRLVLHLIKGVSEHPKDASLTDSEELLMRAVELTPNLATIVEVGSADASMIAAMHTKNAPLNYLVLHHGADYSPAQQTIERLSSIQGFEAAMNARSYPRTLRGKQRGQARKDLEKRIRAYASKTADVQVGWYRKGFPLVAHTTNETETPHIPPPASIVVRDPTLIGNGRFGSIDELLAAARHKGYANAILMLPPKVGLAPESDVRGETRGGRFVGYRLKMTTAPVGDVYETLIARAMGATSTDP